jgi:hypothetical protein
MTGQSTSAADDQTFQRRIFGALGAWWLGVRAFAWKANIEPKAHVPASRHLEANVVVFGAGLPN